MVDMPAGFHRALTNAARAECKAFDDDWGREGPEGLMEAYGPSSFAAIKAFLGALPPHPETIHILDCLEEYEKQYPTFTKVT